MNMVVLIGRLVRDPSYSEVETEKGKYHMKFTFRLFKKSPGTF